MLTPFCFCGMHIMPFCGSEVHKFEEVCVYMPLFGVCNILSTIFSVRKERQRKEMRRGIFLNVASLEIEENILIISVLLA